MIHNNALFVRKCSKAEDVCDGLVYVVGDEVRTGRVMLILGKGIVNR